ncbi:MAG: hypothetical protein A2X95_04890 [Syntrophobacterales bacterium GWF2_56_9]|nr:MAG: hypothetical protein A2X95_04890 [Syntrophobacterales bacterium GWF2_56_9]
MAQYDSGILFCQSSAGAVVSGELETLIFTRPKVGYMLNVRKEAVMILPWRAADIYSDKFYLIN